MKISPVGQYGQQLRRFGAVNCYLVREADVPTRIECEVSRIAQTTTFHGEILDTGLFFAMPLRACNGNF